MNEIDQESSDLRDIIVELLASAGEFIYQRGDFAKTLSITSVYKVVQRDFDNRSCNHAQKAERVLQIASKLIDRAGEPAISAAMRVRKSSESDIPSEDTIKNLIEFLTGTWLALYFLGIPFIHPWEAVLRLIERRGFPGAGSTCKACGDIYREARKAHCRYKQRATNHEGVVVLDHNPLLLTEVKAKPSDRSLHGLIGLLGACYELLQLRLYVREGGPILHCVLGTSLARCLAVGGDVDKRIKELYNVKQLVYPSSRNGASAEQREWQRVVVIEDDYDGSKGATDVPGCILSLNSGIIRSRVNRREGDGPFQSAQTNASYLFGGQVDLYRKALSSPERQDVKTMDLEEFKTMCCIQLKKYDSPAAANSSTCCAVLNGLPQSGRVVADSGSAG